jgi:hypothetical protein
MYSFWMSNLSVHQVTSRFGSLVLMLRSNSRYCLCLLWLLSEVSVHTFNTVRQNQTGWLTAGKANTWQAGKITDFVYTNICCHLIIKEFKTHNSVLWGRFLILIMYLPWEPGSVITCIKTATTRGVPSYLIDHFGPTNTVQFKNPFHKANYCSINCF